MSIAGPLRSILIPEALGFNDPKELSRALLAWRFDLSRQEVRILEHLARGLTDVQIAAQMRSAGLNTVKKSMRNIFSKLGVHNRTQAAIIAAIYGLAGQPSSPRHPNE